MADEQTELPAAPPKKKSGLLLKLVIALVVLGGGGGGAAWWFLGAKAQAAAEEPPLESRGLVTFEPFLVNLTDAGGGRFLKANIGLVVETPEEAKKIKDTPVVIGHLRSAMLELLAEQSAGVLVTPEGKEALKKTIREKTGALLRTQKVLDVLFSEFVVQF